MQYLKCKTCAHWKTEQERSNYELEMRDADFNVIPADFEVRYCKDPKLMKFERPLEKDQASVADGSTYRAVLITAEDFGCNHHKPK